MMMIFFINDDYTMEMVNKRNLGMVFNEVVRIHLQE